MASWIAVLRQSIMICVCWKTEIVLWKGKISAPQGVSTSLVSKTPARGLINERTVVLRRQGNELCQTNRGTWCVIEMGAMTGDVELERLYDDHAQALFGFLLNLTREEEDTHDLLQEIFIKLARQPDLLRGVREERAFLIRLAHNAAVDLMRRRGARQKYHEEFGAEMEPATAFAPSNDPDEQAFRAAVNEALGDLPPEQRAVVHLKLWEGLTFEGIAEALEIPLNTAASRYRYGLDKLRERLRPLYDEIK
jgi:RNA polymerase sigma-70 factor (ECF subfamily)